MIVRTLNQRVPGSSPYHPVSANRTFPARRRIARFCGGFRPLSSRILVSAGVLAFVPAFGGIWLYTYDGRPKCDDASVVATVKSLASDRLKSSPRSLLDTGSSKDFRSRQGMLKELSNPDYRKPPKPEYTLSAVRDRRAFGKYGTTARLLSKSCLAAT